MTISEIIERLQDQYSNSSKYDIKNLREWIVSEGMSDQQIEDLYHYVTQQYMNKTFPPLGKIINIWEVTHGTEKEKFKYSDFQKRAIENGREMTVKEISDKINSIRYLQSPRNADIDFIDVWDDLATVWGILLEYNIEAARVVGYTKKLHAAICVGERINVEKVTRSFIGTQTKNYAPQVKKMVADAIKQVPEAES
jgi:hypothetical protein